MPHDHSHAAGPGRVTPEEAKRITGAATWASLAVAAVLVVSKLVRPAGVPIGPVFWA